MRSTLLTLARAALTGVYMFRRWLTPQTVTATKEEVGIIWFHVGWCSFKVKYAIYLTPFGEIPHRVDVDTAVAILASPDSLEALRVLAKAEDDGLLV